MKSKIVYWLSYAGMWLFALLPLRVLFVFSDVCCWVLHYIVRYRRRTVRMNLRNSFPEKSPQELRQIERRFYHYLCDYFVEEVKTMHLTFEELTRRMEYDNVPQFLDMIDRHGGIVVLIPHYANFEWLIGMASIMKKGDLPIQIYKPLHDPYMDEMFKKIRAKFGGINVAKHDTARQLVRFYREGNHMAVGMITDQSPNLNEAHYWTTFLNQDTVFMDGAERIARMMDFPVFYSEIYRLRRGYCRVRFDLLTEHPKQEAGGAITELFARRLEQTIRRDPPYWFWSHKRWKLKRESLTNK